MNFFSSGRPIVVVGHVDEASAKVFVCANNTSNISVNSTLHYNQEILIEGHILAKVFEFYELTKNTEYVVEFYIDKEVRTARFHTADYSARKISFLAGSCNLHSLGFINNPDIPYKTIINVADTNNSKFMIHLGDQIYSDIPNPFFRPSFKHYADKYFDAWSDCKSTNDLLSKISNYMILDDHEIINNYANRKDRIKYTDGIKAYNIFQHSHNPTSKNGKYYYTFQQGIFPFFVMDTRLERNKHNRLMISSEQELDLYTWLYNNKYSESYKFICTSVPFTIVPKSTENDKWESKYFSQQRNRILKFILKNKIHNVVFISADIHNSMISHTTLSENGSTTDFETVFVVEIVSSPINQLSLTPWENYEHISAKVAENMSISTFTREFYNESSNVSVIDVEYRKLIWKLYNTKKNINVINEEYYALK